MLTQGKHMHDERFTVTVLSRRKSYTSQRIERRENLDAVCITTASFDFRGFKAMRSNELHFYAQVQALWSA
jgi:hypothetical protein